MCPRLCEHVVGCVTPDHHAACRRIYAMVPWPGMWVDRIALTFTSPSDQTICGSSVALKVIRLANSAGPPPSGG